MAMMDASGEIALQCQCLLHELLEGFVGLEGVYVIIHIFHCNSFPTGIINKYRAGELVQLRGSGIKWSLSLFTYELAGCPFLDRPLIFPE